MKKILILTTLFSLIALPVLAQNNVIGTPAVTIKGELTEISNTILKVKKNSTLYQINLIEKTRFVRKFGGKSKLSEFTVGDLVQVVGKKIAENTIEAQLVHDISIQKRRASFEGKVISINPEQKSFVLKPNVRKEQTVFVADETKITKNGQKITFTEIAVGDRVNVSGIWNTKNNTLLAEKIVVKIERFVIQGKITAIDSANKTIQIKAQIATPKELKGKEVTITLDETKIWYLGKKWTFADLAVDQRVIAKGIKKAETLTAQQIRVISVPKKSDESTILPGPAGLGSQGEGHKITIKGEINDKKWKTFEKSLSFAEALPGERPYKFSLQYPEGCQIGSDREGVVVYCPENKLIIITGPDTSRDSSEIANVLNFIKNRAPSRLIDENYRVQTLNGIILSGIVYKSGDNSLTDKVFTFVGDEDNTFVITIYLNLGLYESDPQFKSIYRHLIKTINVSTGPKKSKE